MNSDCWNLVAGLLPTRDLVAFSGACLEAHYYTADERERRWRAHRKKLDELARRHLDTARAFVETERAFWQAREARRVLRVLLFGRLGLSTEAEPVRPECVLVDSQFFPVDLWEGRYPLQLSV